MQTETMKIENLLANFLKMETVGAMLGHIPQVQPAPAIANKYVCYERPDLEGVEGLRLGEPYDLHSDMVPKGAKVISAGFYQQVLIHPGADIAADNLALLEIRVWGYSESLKVTSRPTDAAIIKQYLTR
jgi:hypothetical protein